MDTPEQIVCKPTPWFLLRAGVMLTMFSVFAVLFFMDGTTGYRRKNLEFYVHSAFQQATTKFSEMSAKGNLTPDGWRMFAEKQIVGFPPDRDVLPKNLIQPMPWPKILTDYDKVKSLQSHLIWQEYSGENRMSNKVTEHSFDAEAIRVQIRVFYICLALSTATLFFLIRTSRRSLRADTESFTTADGHRIPYADMRALDLRKWHTKGIALIDYDTASGRNRARIDGLTYGGFKKEQDQPAERLMHRIRENFSGELIEYTAVETGDTSEGA